MSSIIAPVLTPTVPGTALTVQIGMGIYDLSTVTLDDTPGSNTSEKKASENLEAELKQMKAMMEQMRLDKERLEMDVKRYEMDAKRKEEEEVAALRKMQEQELAAKEKKELDVIFQQFQNHAICIPNPHIENPNTYTYGKNEKQLLTMIKNSGETILFTGFNNYVTYGNPDEPIILYQSGIYPNVQSRGISLILTNYQIYGVYYNFDKVEYCENVHAKTLIKMNYNMSFYCASLYQFSEPLNIKYATMLLHILKPQRYNNSSIPSLLSNVQLLDLQNIGTSSNLHAKRFESIIRLIPGSYKNGSWRQLDGFFGMYFNEITMELSEVPPPTMGQSEVPPPL